MRISIVVVHIFLVCSIGGSIAANWNDDSHIDRASGKKIIHALINLPSNSEGFPLRARGKQI